jgi:hypothetical protein
MYLAVDGTGRVSRRIRPPGPGSLLESPGEAALKADLGGGDD